jgi:GTP-binding protein YchF
MKVGIAGFSASGKSTVFHWLTGVKPDPGKAQHGQLGMAKIPDERLDWLSAHFKPKKTTPATLEFLDTPGLMTGERKDNPRRLAILRDSDGLLIILTGYADTDVAAELIQFRDELLFADLEVVTNRIDRLKDQMKKAKPAKEKELDQHELTLLERVHAGFERNEPASAMGLKPDEEKAVRSFQLLTLKPQFALVNCSESLVGKPLPAKLLGLAPQAIAAPAKLEMELEELSEEDRKTFMQELGLGDSSRGDVLRKIYYAMNMQVFFTVGEDECRAWTIAKGDDAVTGAGKIHTDLAKSFVRAEVVAYEDFKKVGSMKEAKTHGVYRLEGKTYEVKDGDIMHIL